MKCTKCKNFEWCPTRRGFLCFGFQEKEKIMTYKEYQRYKRNKNRAKKHKKKREEKMQEEAGVGTIILCLMPFVIASMYYIVVLGAA